VSGLTPEQEARIHALLLDELRMAWEAARAAGVPESELAESIERRRRTLGAAATEGEAEQPLT